MVKDTAKNNGVRKRYIKYEKVSVIKRRVAELVYFHRWLRVECMQARVNASMKDQVTAEDSIIQSLRSGLMNEVLSDLISEIEDS